MRNSDSQIKRVWFTTVAWFTTVDPQQAYHGYFTGEHFSFGPVPFFTYNVLMAMVHFTGLEYEVSEDGTITLTDRDNVTCHEIDPVTFTESNGEVVLYDTTDLGWVWCMYDDINAYVNDVNTTCEKITDTWAVNALARTFSTLLLAELGYDKMQIIIQRNKTEKTGACHTHDFCDANVYMDKAAKKLGWNFLQANAESYTGQKELELFNTAWTVAKESEFYFTPLLPEKRHLMTGRHIYGENSRYPKYHFALYTGTATDGLTIARASNYFEAVEKYRKYAPDFDGLKMDFWVTDVIKYAFTEPVTNLADFMVYLKSEPRLTDEDREAILRPRNAPSSASAPGNLIGTTPNPYDGFVGTANGLLRFMEQSDMTHEYNEAYHFVQEMVSRINTYMQIEGEEEGIHADTREALMSIPVYTPDWRFHAIYNQMTAENKQRIDAMTDAELRAFIDANKSEIGSAMEGAEDDDISVEAVSYWEYETIEWPEANRPQNDSRCTGCNSDLLIEPHQEGCRFA